MHPALAEVAALLACPECGLPLAAADRVLRCGRGHSFDVAKQGYVSLLTGASTKMTGDTADMLDARAAFQGAGHFTPIALALVTATGSRLSGGTGATAEGLAVEGRTAPADATFAETSAVLEIGAGTGYYLAHLLDAVPSALGIALDVSKPAARRCARAHPRAASVLADAWRGLPIGDGRLDAVLAVFAPRNPAEVARVLRADGRFVVAGPTPRHLAELVGPLDMVTVDPDKDRRLGEAVAGHFEQLDRTVVEYSMALSHSDIAHVVGMGPSAFHAGDRMRQAIAALPESVEVTASVIASTFRPVPR
ncbi:putative RNA methyltransferase [Nocardia bovistercoris]|uniref:Methyltransferase domain-containing protein n=1 Tax=Nocardia bovistercoris TaxID=2785916 RepID=A0A931N2U3_9NOCA|nr:methyltransferase domain-containing protein [Nocardia bovistercoris]MBH0775883.1 methyltransferase domain-containing protein [Nocardia bovistercoris]